MNISACLFFYLVIVFYPFSAIQAQNVPSYVPTNGLVGWWPFNGNANDESGNGNHGLISGPTTIQNRFGIGQSAYFFDGIDDRITIGQFNNPPLANYSITLSAWIQTTQNNSNSMVVIGCRGNGPTALVVQPDMLLTSTYANSGGGFHNLDVNSVNIKDGNWHCLTMVYDALYMKLYVDNVLIIESPFVFTLLVNGLLEFGRDFPYGSYFTGKIDDIGIWNRALNLTEVQQLYAAQTTNSNSSYNSSLTSNFPSGISYQAIARDSSGQPLANASLNVRFTLRDSSLNGPAAYIETHSLNTGSLGLFSTVIGTGTSLSGNYSSLQWMGPPKFLSVEIDVGNGFQLIGNQQLVSVPYANAADRAARIKNANLPVHNDNGSAISGGLEPGDMYRTPGGVMMIVY